MSILDYVILSGHPPFKDYNNIIELVSFINNGVREKPVLGTPIEYEELYKNCWMQEPEQRPTIDEIINEFKKMDFRNRLNPSELLNFIKDYKLTRFIKKDELTAMTEIYSSNIRSIHDDGDNDTDIKDTKLNVNDTDNKYMEDDNDDLNSHREKSIPNTPFNRANLYLLQIVEKEQFFPIIVSTNV
ncbi:246_t:CDS:2 [Rhizophagus irregularis]|nr:246_t:CDS:2 [Rhizophagus irregularis]